MCCCNHCGGDTTGSSFYGQAEGAFTEYIPMTVNYSVARGGFASASEAALSSSDCGCGYSASASVSNGSAGCSSPAYYNCQPCAVHRCGCWW